MSRTARFLRTPEGVAGAVLLTVLVSPRWPLPYVFPARSARDRRAGHGAAFHDAAHPLGTDRLGRDVLAGLFTAHEHPSPLVSAAAAASLIFGAIISTTASLRRPPSTKLCMRVRPMRFQTVPGLLALAFSVLGPSLPVVVTAVALGSSARTRARGAAECCRCANAVSWPLRRTLRHAPVEVAFRRILPNALPPVARFLVCDRRQRHSHRSRVVLSGAWQPPTRVTWGGIVAEGRVVLRGAPSVDRPWRRPGSRSARRLPDQRRRIESNFEPAVRSHEQSFRWHRSCNILPARAGRGSRSCR